MKVLKNKGLVLLGKRRQVEVPDRVYHVTKEDYVESILEKGLIKGQERLARFEDEEPHNFVASDWKAVLGIDESFAIGAKLVVLEIDVTGLKETFQPDPAFDFGDYEFDEADVEEGLWDQFSWFTDEVIEPSRIKVFCSVE